MSKVVLRRVGEGAVERPLRAVEEVTRVSGWIIFTICFTTLLVGTWSALTVFEFHRAERRMREAEPRVRPPRGRGL